MAFDRGINEFECVGDPLATGENEGLCFSLGIPPDDKGGMSGRSSSSTSNNSSDTGIFTYRLCAKSTSSRRSSMVASTMPL